MVNTSECVIYIPGVGDLPKDQENLEMLWSPLGLTVDTQKIDWTKDDYFERLNDIGERLIHLAKLGRVSLVGASGGGKPALSLFARYPNDIHRVVTISGKVDPYNISARTKKTYPNLVLLSEQLQNDLPRINSEMLKKVLCVHPLNDEIVSPKDAVIDGASQHTVQANGHNAGITRSLTLESPVIARFIHQE